MKMHTKCMDIVNNVHYTTDIRVHFSRAFCTVAEPTMLTTTRMLNVVTIMDFV